MSEINVLLKLKDALGQVINPATAEAQANTLATLGQVRALLDLIDDDTLQMVTLLTTLVQGQQSDALTDAELRTAPVDVHDDYAADLLTPDQNGAGNVLTFDLGVTVKFVAVDVDASDLQSATNFMCRASLDGTDPTATRGWRCRSGQTTYIPMPCAGIVKVYAPAGVTVSVQAGRR